MAGIKVHYDWFWDMESSTAVLPCYQNCPSGLSCVGNASSSQNEIIFTTESGCTWSPPVILCCVTDYINKPLGKREEQCGNKSRCGYWIIRITWKKSVINCSGIKCQMERNAFRTKGWETTIVMHLAFYFKMVIATWERDCVATEDRKRIRWRLSILWKCNVY